MSVADINSVLAEMRALAARASEGTAQTPQAATGGDQVSFASVLEQSLDHVNQTQKGAAEMAQAFELGAPATDLSDVMLAMQRADVSFRAMNEVRNKLVDAYREIMSMPL